MTAANALGTTPRGRPLQSLSVVASENIEANSVVHIWNTGSAAQARNASATDLARPARGYVKAPVSPGGPATVYLPGSVIPGFTNLVKGADYFLSEVPGQLTTTPPPNAQYVGTAVSATSLMFNPGEIAPRS